MSVFYFSPCLVCTELNIQSINQVNTGTYCSKLIVAQLVKKLIPHFIEREPSSQCS